MEDAADGQAAAALALFLQDRDRVGRRRAGVDDQRLAHLLRGPDMRAEALALPLHVGNRAAALALVHLVVVQAGLADPDDTRQLRARHEVVERGLRDAFFVGMHADARPEVVVARRERMDGVELLELRADAQRAIDLRSRHGLPNLRQLGQKLGKGKMAMRIDEGHAVTSCASDDLS